MNITDIITSRDLSCLPSPPPAGLLHAAAAANWAEGVSALATAGTVDQHDDTGRTPLSVAVAAGAAAAAAALVAAGASTGARAGDRNAPLRLASAAGHAECVKIVLEAQVNYVIQHHDLPAPAQAAVATAAEVLCDPNDAYHSQIMRIVFMGEPALTHAVFSSGFSPNTALCRLSSYLEVFTRMYSTPLQPVETLVASLVAAGADVNCKKRRPPLYTAVVRKNFRMARTLTAAGACIDPEYEAEHANQLRLWTAVLRGDLDELRRRIDAGDSVDQAPQGGKARGWTALWLAVALGREDAARMLIQAGADVNIAGYDGLTILLMCLDQNYDNLTSLVLDHGADVNQRDSGGRSPLEAALLRGSGQIARRLVALGANISSPRRQGGRSQVELMLQDAEVGAAYRDFMMNMFNYDVTVDGATAKISPLVPSNVIRAIVPEDTPFWLAANNDAPMLALELIAGLNPNMKTENGMTLLHWACAGDAPECVQLLLDAGADIDDPDLILSCMHTNSVCLECLLSCGVSVAPPSPGRDPLCYALSSNSPPCAAVLVGAGVDPAPAVAAALRARPVPVDALSTVLKLARPAINGQPLLYYAVQYSTAGGVAAVVSAGCCPDETWRDEGGRVIYSNVLEFARFLHSNARIYGRGAYGIEQEVLDTICYLESILKHRNIC